MMKVIDIYNYLNKIAPFETAMSFDNCGLLIGDSQKEVTNVIITLDITKKVVMEAKEKNANLIISHHPVIFNGVKSIEFDSVIALLIKHEINTIAVHTNLDIANLGVNYQLASHIGLKDIKLMEWENECISVGTLKEEISETDFAKNIKENLNCNGLRFTKLNQNIKKVAVACGAGGEAVFKAKKLGANALVTGEIKHHEIIYGIENNISIFDAGHYKSEDIVINPLIEMLKKEFKEINFLKSEVFTDSIEYI